MRMVIEDAVREAGTDPIFAVAQKASEAKEKYGKENVIDSTLGALMDDEGNLVTFNEVYNTLKNLPDDKIAAYADIGGIEEFLEAVPEACFRDQRPDAYIKAVATPGGTGAVRNAIANYSNYGDKILIPDWHWAPYRTIADEHKRGYQLFSLFNDEGRFNLESYKKEFKKLLNDQGRILTILNTPAHNPTGFTINDDEWDKIIEFWIEEAKNNPDKQIVVLNDIAYVDFAKEGSRKFMKKLEHLPENILPLYAFSASKGYTMYGLRNGALICAAPTQEIADEFEASAIYSNRANWSNGTRGAMQVLADIINDPTSYERFLSEQTANREMLRKRGDALVEECKNVGLNICEYDDGFFMSIPVDNPQEITEALYDDNIFLIALSGGIRVALCAVSEDKCRKIPKAVKEAIDKRDNKYES